MPQWDVATEAWKEVITRGTLRVGDTVLPATPTSLRAEAMSGGRVRLAWLDKAIGETGYVVSASVDRGDWRDVKTLPGDTVEAVLSFRPGQALGYRVAATCPGGRSAPSNVVDVDTRTSLPPPDL
jgi:titin